MSEFEADGAVAGGLRIWVERPIDCQDTAEHAFEHITHPSSKGAM